MGIGEIRVLAEFAQYAIRLIVGQARVDHVLNALKPGVYRLFTPDMLCRVVVADFLAAVGLEVTAML